jgi:LysM repeat protein
MTAVLAPAIPARSRRHVDERTYRRRRTVVGTVAATVVVLSGVAVHDVLAGPGGVPASAAGAQPAPVEVRIVATPGDTMWSIAERHHGEIPLVRYLEALIDRNGGPTLQAGQVVVVP